MRRLFPAVHTACTHVQPSTHYVYSLTQLYMSTYILATLSAVYGSHDIDDDDVDVNNDDDDDEDDEADVSGYAV